MKLPLGKSAPASPSRTRNPSPVLAVDDVSAAEQRARSAERSFYDAVARASAITHASESDPAAAKRKAEMQQQLNALFDALAAARAALKAAKLAAAAKRLSVPAERLPRAVPQTSQSKPVSRRTSPDRSAPSLHCRLLVPQPHAHLSFRRRHARAAGWRCCPAGGRRHQRTECKTGVV